MSLKSWGRAGGWTAIAAAVALLGILLTWSHHVYQAREEILRRVGTLERSSDWQETVLYLLAQKARIPVPPRPARIERPDPDTASDGLFAADINRTEPGACP